MSNHPTPLSAEQLASACANEIADQFTPGFFDDGMVDGVAAIVQKHYDALLAEVRQLRADAGQPAEYKIGIRGMAYDSPTTKRAYTYDHQPNNVAAWNLGAALHKASEDGGGDQIDVGLALLNRLQEAGFGVFEIDAALTQGGK